MPPRNPKPPKDTSDAFVAKLSADGSSVAYFRVLAGSLIDSANALVVAGDGSVYVAGTTSSPDFPATPSALQTTLGTSVGGQAFVGKLDPTGAVVYLSYFGGTAETSSSALAVDAAGEVYLTGNFASVEGFPGPVVGYATGYVAKIDGTGSKLLAAVNGFGGNVIALDQQGNVYVAGTGSQPPGGAFATPGAFQSCAGVPIVQVTQCSGQYVEKADPTMSNITYATFLSGSFGASPAAIIVDSGGNVILAGTTNSQDYPVTSDAFQSQYLASAVPPAQFGFGSGTIYYPPPTTGYVTKLNADGSGLLWSTFFGGSNQDAISAMAIDANGDIYIAGQANSADLPGSFAAPTGCRPSVT